MSVSRTPHDLDLMQYADGELDEGAVAELEAALAADPELAARLAGLGELGDLVRGDLEAHADELSAARTEALWREIDKGLDRDVAAEVAPVAAAAPVGRGAGHRLARWLERFRSHLITGALSAGAVAALAIVLRPATVEQVGSTASGPIEVRPVAQRAPAVIESLDVPDGTGNVINVHDEDGNTTVIWVTPADKVEGI